MGSLIPCRGYTTRKKKSMTMAATVDTTMEKRFEPPIPMPEEDDVSPLMTGEAGDTSHVADPSEESHAVSALVLYPPARLPTADYPLPAPRAELLHVLLLPDFERVARVGEFWS